MFDTMRLKKSGTGVFDTKVMQALAPFPVWVGANRRKGTNDLGQIHFRKQPLCCPVQLPEALRRCGEGRFDFFAHAADEQISFHTGNGGNAFAAAACLMEEHHPGLWGSLIQHQIFRAIPVKPGAPGKQQLLYPVREEPGTVDYRAARDGPPVGFQKIAGIGFFDVRTELFR